MRIDTLLDMTSILKAGAIALLATAFAAVPAMAHMGMMHDGCPTGQAFAVGDITVSGAFTRATLPNAPVGAGYLAIENAGTVDDRLLRVSSEVSPGVELHAMSHADGMMRMEELPDGIEVPAGETVILAPGGLHIMFLSVDQPFVEGECVEAVLEFEHAGPLEVQLNVGPLGAREAPDGHDDHADH